MNRNKTLFTLSLLFLIVGAGLAWYTSYSIGFEQNVYLLQHNISSMSGTLHQEKDRNTLEYLWNTKRDRETVLTPYVTGFLLLACIGSAGLLAWAYQNKKEGS